MVATKHTKVAGQINPTKIITYLLTEVEINLYLIIYGHARKRLQNLKDSSKFWNKIWVDVSKLVGKQDFNILAMKRKLIRETKNKAKLFSIHILFFPFKSKRNIRIYTLLHSVHKSNNYDADSLNLDLFEKHCEYINKNFTPISLKAIRLLTGIACR